MMQFGLIEALNAALAPAQEGLNHNFERVVEAVGSLEVAQQRTNELLERLIESTEAGLNASQRRALDSERAQVAEAGLKGLL